MALSLTSPMTNWSLQLGHRSSSMHAFAKRFLLHCCMACHCVSHQPYVPCLALHCTAFAEFMLVGSQGSTFGIPGVEKYSHPLRDIHDANAIRSYLMLQAHACSEKSKTCILFSSTSCFWPCINLQAALPFPFPSPGHADLSVHKVVLMNIKTLSWIVP